MSDAQLDSKSVAYRYRFGTAEFDEARFELRVAGLAVDVQRKPLEVLALLLRRAGEVVTREEFQDSLWDGRPTAENVLTNAINKLRNALGDAAAEMILTQPRVGYRLAGSVERVALGRALSSHLSLAPGDAVPGRPSYVLRELLGASQGFEVWLARHLKTKESRVFKFALNATRLSGLKREATLFRLLKEGLGERPDLVAVLDWNFETPPFYLECSYGGTNLATWASTDDVLTNMQPSERLALFLQIADAVAAAHALGVLHKDLKPTNVLIAPQECAGWQIRVTDFGSGQLLEPGRLAELGITQLGFTQTLAVGDSSGTPLYLAPELIAEQPPTIKSDLYALGIILYQLLVGDLKKPLVSGWQRDIDDELLREDIGAATDGNPLHRLGSVTELTERLRQLATRRVLRAEQQTRAAEAVALQETLRRSRARRPWIAASGLILLAGLISSYRAQQSVAQKADVIEQLNAFLIEDFVGAANPLKTQRADMSVADAARAAAARIDTRFASSSETRAALHAAMQRAWRGLGRHEDAIAEANKAIAAYQQTARPDVGQLRMIRLQLARSLLSLLRLEQADALLAQLEREVAADTNTPPEFKVRLLLARARYHELQKRPAEAVAELQLAERLAPQLPAAAQDVRDEVERSLAMHYNANADELRKGELLLRAIMARQTSRNGAHSWEVLNASLALGANLMYQGRSTEADRTLTAVIEGLTPLVGATHPNVLTARSYRASVRFDQEQYAAALEEWSQLRSAILLNPSNKELLVTTNSNIGRALLALGRRADAVAALRAGLQATRGYLAEDAPQVQVLEFELANVLLDLHQPGEAAGLLVGLELGILKRGDDRKSWDSWLLYAQGRLALAQGRRTQGLDLLTQADGLLTGDKTQPGPGDSDLAPLLRAAISKARGQQQ